MFRTLPHNANGRDFVVGDLHGCSAFLERLLDHVGFDARTDRLLSVGDLVDRGPDSFGCLNLLLQPWFHAVRGNHETMLLDFVWDSLWAKGRPPFNSGHVLLENGGDWILRHYDPRKEAWSADFIRLLEFVAALPLVVTVGEGSQRYHIVHADFFSPDGPDTILRDTDIERLASVWRNFPLPTSPPATFPDFTNRFLWSRAVMTGFTKAPRVRFLDGLSPTFCGHTIDPEIRTERSHICLDTGAFLAHYGAEAGGNTFGLSLVDVKRGTAYTLGGTRANYRISESSVLLRA